MVQILWNFRSQSSSFEDTKDFVSSDETDLSDSMRVTQNDTNLRGSQASTGKFVDLFDDFAGSGFEPGGSAAGVREGRGRNALSGCVHTT